MWGSLLIRLGMWAVTVAVVFWIGWSVPMSLDREHESDFSPLKMANAEGPSTQAAEPAVTQPATPSMAPPETVVEPKPAARTGKLDLNHAALEDIESLPGIGPVLAERIVEYRKTKGAFRSVGDLRLVKGIGKKKFERVRMLVSVTPAAKPSQAGKRAA